MKVYIAAPWRNKAEARAARDLVVAAGYEVTSRWIDMPDGTYEQPEAVMCREAHRDVEDLGQAAHLIYLNFKKSEGKAVELGIFLARKWTNWDMFGIKHRIFVIGGKQHNVFLHLKDIEHVETVEAAIEQLGR